LRAPIKAWMGVRPAVSRPVRALLVVVAQVGREVARQAVQLGHQAAREGRPPAFLEDRPLGALDGAVGRRSTGTDEGLPRAELTERRTEPGAS